VDEGSNGLKVPVYSVRRLADAIEKLIINPDLIENMGYQSRIKAEREFDVNAVIKSIWKSIKVY
jgi:glycosyltransferase involved in cell wall biosynthesis